MLSGSEFNLFLDKTKITAKGLVFKEVRAKFIEYFMTQEQVKRVYTEEEILKYTDQQDQDDLEGAKFFFPPSFGKGRKKDSPNYHGLGEVGDFIEDFINNPDETNLNFTNIHLGQSTII